MYAMPHKLHVSMPHHPDGEGGKKICWLFK